MAKDAKYIANIETLCDSDLREGRKLILEERLKECIKNEDYETCEGIKRSLAKLEDK